MPYSPARWPPYSRPGTSRLLKVDHYMVHVRIEMRLGAYASSRQDTDYTGAGVVRSYDPGSVTRGTACLTQVCVQGDIEALTSVQARRAAGTTSFGYRSVLGGFEEPWNLWLRARRSMGTPQGCSRGGDGVKKFSQSSKKVMAAVVRRPSHRTHCATRTRSKFAFLWSRSG
jgi:hypothetical protein